jgi:hypothetical protein
MKNFQNILEKKISNLNEEFSKYSGEKHFKP